MKDTGMPYPAINVTVRVNAYDLNVLKKGIMNFEGIAQKRVMGGLTVTAKKIESFAQALAPKDTGALKENIKARRYKNTVIVRANTPYAAMQEWGFEPHYVSTARHPEVLAWMIKKGLEPSPYLLVKKFPRGIGYFMEPAVMHALGILPPELKKDVTKAIKEAFAGARPPKGNR